MLVPKGSLIFFDEEAHKYTNELGLVYTSVTTLIGKYECHKDFDAIAESCERIGRNPRHPKYQKYRGKTAKQIKAEWAATTKVSCDFGSDRHNFLETTIKTINKYKTNAKGFIEGRIYTIDNIIEKHNYGRIKLSDLNKMGLDRKYPRIYNALKVLIENGYHIYAEIGVYDNIFCISGLIDILAVNHDTNEFIIVDWKTNKAPLRFDAGYYDKTSMNTLDLEKWIPSDDKMEYPLNHLPDSTGIHYSLQLSLYAYLVTTFGFIFKGLMLCHIRPIEEMFTTRDTWQEVTELYPIKYLEKEVVSLLSDHHKNIIHQTKMLF